jgi:hypothetical protein
MHVQDHLVVKEGTITNKIFFYIFQDAYLLLFNREYLLLVIIIPFLCILLKKHEWVLLYH